MQPVPFSELRRTLLPLMRERTPSDAQLVKLIASGVVPSVRLQTREVTGVGTSGTSLGTAQVPFYDPLRVVTALAAADLSSGIGPAGNRPDDTGDAEGERDTPAVTLDERAADGNLGAPAGLPLTDIANRLIALLGTAAPSLSTLRNWEREGLITPVRELPSGKRSRRFYDFETVRAVALGRTGHGHQGQREDSGVRVPEGEDKLVSLLKAAELLRQLLGPAAPVYLTLRRWETAGRIAPDAVRPSGRKLYRLDTLLSLVRDGHGTAYGSSQETVPEALRPSGLGPHSAEGGRRAGPLVAQLIAQLVDLLPEHTPTNQPVSFAVNPLAGFRETAQMLNTSLETVLGRLDQLGAQGAPAHSPSREDMPEGVPPGAAIAGLTASIQDLLQTFEGLKKSVLLRQDSEIQLLRERVRELEARVRESQPQFIGRSGTRY